MAFKWLGNGTLTLTGLASAKTLVFPPDVAQNQTKGVMVQAQGNGTVRYDPGPNVPVAGSVGFLLTTNGTPIHLTGNLARPGFISESGANGPVLAYRFFSE